MPPEKPKFIPLAERKNYHRFEDVIGCKWSSSVVAAVAGEVTRPGELERFIPGISTKILNERLRKLVAFGVLTRTEQTGLPRAWTITSRMPGRNWPPCWSRCGS